jgi:hypothetical protein
VLTSSNGAQILYILVILVLLFGLSGLWLESQGPHGRCSSRNSRHKKREYVSSSDSEDEDFPGGWRYKSAKDEKEAPKTWKDSMKGKVKEWEDTIKMKTMSDKAKGKQRAQDEVEEEQDSGDRGEGKGKPEDKADCCGCCRTLLDQCRQNEIERRKEEAAEFQQKKAELEKAVEQAWASQLRNEGNNQASSSEKKAATQTTSTTVPTTSTSSPATTSKEEQKTPGSTSQPASSSKGKDKTKETAAGVIRNDSEVIAEPPEPMPERAGVNVEPLTDESAVSSVLSAKGREKSSKSPTSEKDKSSESIVSVDKKDGNEEAGGEAKPSIAEVKKDNKDEASVSDESNEEKGEGKLKQGLHFIADVTKNITEEVLKQVLAHLDDQGGGSKGKPTTENSQQSASKDSAGKSSDSASGPKKDESETAKKEVDNQPAEKGKPQKVDKAADEGASAVESNTSKGKLEVVIEADKKPGGDQSQSSAPAGQDSQPQDDGKKAADTKNQIEKDVTASATGSEAPPAASTTLKENDKGKGKEKESQIEQAEGQSDTVELKDCEPVLESAIQVLLEAFQKQNNEKNLYYKSADYLAGTYPSIVQDSSEKVNKSLDENFASASNSQNVKVKIPWYSYKGDTQDTEPHQDGSEPKVVKKAEAASESKSDKEDREAIMRALNLWQVYKEECEKDNVKEKDSSNGKEGAKAGTSEVKKESKAENDADGILQNIIESLLKGQLEEQDKGARIKEWTDQVAVEARDSDAPSRSTSGYPNVIPLDAVNASSLAKAGVFSKHQQQLEKQFRRNETLKSAATEARKSMAQMKDDLLKERVTATSKAKVLKSLLKKKTTVNEESSGGDQEKRIKSKSPRKSVRLQDAAGRGEGPRDISRGETEQEARYRRLREMASRLND